jgi:AcrR family transcriptional regulator
MDHTTGRLNADERKAQILRCATKVFARSNYRVAGIAEIAKEAGISEPTVYKYFPSKKQLFLEILKKVGDVTLRQWQDLADVEADATVALKKIAKTQFEATISRPEFLKVQFQALSETDDEEIRQLLRDNFASYVAFLTEVVRKGQRQGRLDGNVDVGAMAWNILAVGFTLNLTSLLGLSHELSFEKLETIGDMLLFAAAPA